MKKLSIFASRESQRETVKIRCKQLPPSISIAWLTSLSSRIVLGTMASANAVISQTVEAASYPTAKMRQSQTYSTSSAYAAMTLFLNSHSITGARN